MDLSKLFDVGMEGSMLSVSVNILAVALVATLVFVWRVVAHRRGKA